MSPNGSDLPPSPKGAGGTPTSRRGLRRRLPQALAAGLGSAAALGFCFGMANGWNDAMFYALAMEASDPRMAASTYALFMAASNVSIVSGALFSKAVADLHGHYRPVLVLFSLLALAALPLANALGRPIDAKDHDAAAP